MLNDIFGVCVDLDTSARAITSSKWGISSSPAQSQGILASLKLTKAEVAQSCELVRPNCASGAGWLMIDLKGTGGVINSSHADVGLAEDIPVGV